MVLDPPLEEVRVDHAFRFLLSWTTQYSFVNTVTATSLNRLRDPTVALRGARNPHVHSVHCGSCAQ